MQLIKATALATTLALAACDSSSDAPLSTAGTNTNITTGNTIGTDSDGVNTNGTTTNPGEPDTTEAGIGSITINTAQPTQLEPLPDVTFNPDSNPVNDGAVLSEDASASADRPESTDGGEAAGSATAGRTDSGSTTGGGSVETPTGTAADAGIAGTGVAADTDDFDTGAGDAVSSDATSTPSSVVIDDPRVPQPEFEAGSLTAADYDDQLNPHLYQDYASDYLQRVGGRLDVPYLDLSNRIGLHVTDEQGLRYGGSRIDISDANGQIVNLEVPSSGVTYIYSDVDNLPEQFTIRATGRYGSAVEKVIDLAQVSSGRIDIVIPEVTAQPDMTQRSTSLDVMFVIDTTGSMGDELSYLQTELNSIITALPNSIVTPNVGLTFYRDAGDEYVVRAHGFNSDTASVQRTLNNEGIIRKPWTRPYVRPSMLAGNRIHTKYCS